MFYSSFSSHTFNPGIQDLRYRVKLSYMGVPGREQTCEKGKGRLARIRTQAGMFSWIDQGSAANVTLVMPPDKLHSFFLPAEPQPGQSTGPPCLDLPGLDPYDCCFTSAFTAAACYSRKHGLSFFTTRARGNATISIGNFSTSVSLLQSGVPIVYSQDILTFRRSVVEIDCSHIEFLEENESVYVMPADRNFTHSNSFH
jgi:hypothetical protein